jgi:hypothetical protein
MLRKCLAVLMVMFTVTAGVAACTVDPDDRGDVTGKSDASSND